MAPHTCGQEQGVLEDGMPLETVPAELVAMLDRLASTIVEALRFGVAVVNLVLPDGSLQVVSVAGDEGARAVLLGHVDTAENWREMLATSEPWGRLRFSDHRNQPTAVAMSHWVPDVQQVDEEGAWHPEDSLFAPLTSADGELLGILSVDLPHDGRRPDEAGLRALEAFSLATALAIEHFTLRALAEASDRINREVALHDPLTGLGNRSMMIRRLAHAVDGRAGQPQPLALVFIDLDGFKNINDLHTHAAGDRILQETARRIRSVVRPHDTVVRWGGDEFLVLLEHLDDATAGHEVARRIAEVVAADPIPFAGNDLRITASVGLAFSTDLDALDTDALVGRADAAMYLVKNAARKRWGDIAALDDLR